ncbi:DUF885 domain-containing protein [Shewanella sedimentimangrovi]|uniref:DUF885 domain-containing protein n=1 Tax=Shewanella sedimentimangrovi TaxID=2814293 RepID=A0ABX7QY78_9GAMM|nr:DUF885 domain-containing protein [Shewanella sedimentimangrovi]QSX35586.1 DUF885 domain-containing protein [Shewanella sedimentimangrovi]
MKKSFLVMALALAGVGSLTGCNPQDKVAPEASAPQAVSQVQDFAAFSNRFIDALWQVAPTWALYSGVHDYDGFLQIPNEQTMAQTLAFVTAQQKALSQFDTGKLSAGELIDYRLIENLLASMAWEQQTFKSWQWDPSGYNVAGGFAQLINEEYASLDSRLKSLVSRLENVPAYYAAARANIVNPTLEHTELALQQNQGAFSVLNDELVAKVAASGLSDADKALFQTRYQAAVDAIKEHNSWLEQLIASLKQDGAKDFRIGEALYEQKFAYDIQSGMTANELYQKALADKDRVQAEMAKLTAQIWDKYISEPMPSEPKIAIRQMIDKLSANHVKRDDFVAEVRAQIPTLVEFVNQHQLLTLDPNKPLVVRETPEYMRGYAGASVSAPGPYDKGGNTYYNVTPLDGMSDESAESYLREYNHWILQVLNIHEAIPGHYTQLVYSNESPSLVKSLFGNGAMVEGWAVYTERMMLEQGYGNFEPEMWLMYYKWNLRVIVNTILDYSIQVKGMDRDEAIRLMTEEAFQQQAEAEGKWRRATLSQVQLTSYYAGYREIYDFREQLKQEQGDKFDLKAFHEQFLSYGSAPVKYIKSLMKEGK